MRSMLLALPIVLAGMVPAPVHAAYLSETTADYGERVINNYFFGTPTSSLVSKPEFLVAGSDRRSMAGFSDIGLKFALGSIIPAQSEILVATLTFSVVDSFPVGGSSPTTTLVTSGSASAAGSLSLNDFSTATGNVGSQSIPTSISIGNSPVIPLAYNVTALVQALVNAGSSSVLFQLDNSTAQTEITIASAGDSNAANRPYLSIVYAPAVATVPEPTSFALVGIATALGLLISRRGHKGVGWRDQ